LTTAAAINPWAVRPGDPVRRRFELPFFESLVRCVFDAAPGARVLDLGCGDGLVMRLGGKHVASYLGVDLFPGEDVPAIRWDLREGLGPAAAHGPFDVCFGTFGVASHMAPGELGRLLSEVACVAAPGALVAIEALGLFSLEWPGIWYTRPGPARTLSYKLAGDVVVHPWSPAELRARFVAGGLRWLGAIDRTVQAGPKLGEYWPGLPRVRKELAALATGDRPAIHALRARLPPLPAHPAASSHRVLADSRRALIARAEAAGLAPRSLAAAVWAIEPATSRGLGHGLVALGRVPR
jgi:SAM-dependent methyltransferase